MCKNEKNNVDSGSQATLAVNSKMAGEVERIIDNSNIAGAYVFFNNGSGYYVRKSENGEKRGEFGEASILSEKGIQKSSTWHSGTGGNMTLCPGYQKIVEAKEETPGLSEMNYAYFDANYVIGNKEQVCTFSIPLLDASENIYGIVGVEIAPSVLKGLISNRDLNGTYMLGVKDSEKGFIENIVFYGDMYQDIIKKENGIWLIDNKDGIYEVGNEGERKVPNAISEDIKFYQENSAFANESWVLCAIVDESEFTASANKMRQAVIVAALCASIVGIIALYWLSRTLTKPISVTRRCIMSC